MRKRPVKGKHEYMMKRHLNPILMQLVLLVGVSVWGVAAPVEKVGVKEYENAKAIVTVRASQDEISIADSLELVVEITVPAGYRARFPEFGEFGFSTDFNERSHRFRATNVTKLEKIPMEDGVFVYRQIFTLEPWLSGNYSILPLMVSFFKAPPASAKDTESDRRDSQDEWQVPVFNVMTDGMRIRVNPLSERRMELSDLYSQSDYHQEKLVERKRRDEDKSEEELKREEEQLEEAAMALKKRRFPWWIIWSLLGFGAMVALYRYIGREKIAKFFSPKKVPAHEVAYRAFEKLKGKDLPRQGKIKEFYYELSYILREYIGNRFGIYAVNQTTEEFFEYLLQSNPFDQEAENILRTFSEHADTVKYSKFRPDMEKADNSFTTAKAFVENTKAVEEETA